jgi:hypothetical protein
MPTTCSGGRTRREHTMHGHRRREPQRMSIRAFPKNSLLSQGNPDKEPCSGYGGARWRVCEADATKRAASGRWGGAGGTRHMGSGGRAKIPPEQSAGGHPKRAGKLYPIAGTPWSSSMRKPKGRWGRISTRRGYGRAFIGMRSL